MYDIFNAYWDFLNKFSPYLLFGFIVAGFLHGLVNDKFIQKNLLGNNFSNIVKATLVGIPLPLCSCGVIPVATSLYQRGASRASTTSFLISTPQTGVDSIIATYGALTALQVPNPELWCTLRPLAASLAGLFGGTLVKIFDFHKDDSQEEECSHQKKSFKDMLYYGIVTLPQDIARPLLIGMLLAAIIAIKPPNELIATYVSYGGLGELFGILLLSIPLYVCATASIPMALALVATETISIGGALIFLMAGPVTNVATMMTIYKVLGKKLLSIYLFSVTSIALLFGYVVNHYLSSHIDNMHANFAHACEINQEPSLLAQACSIIILLILANALLKPFEKKVKGSDLDTKINVSGMTCNHCKQSVTDAIMSNNNVDSVNIDLDSGDVFISGDNFDIQEIYNSIEKIGFKIIK